MRPVVYDAGPLIAADRNDRRFWARHRARLELGLVPIVPAVVVAQVSRSPKQVQLLRLLRGCEIATFDEEDAHKTGALLGRSRTSDAVDAAVVVAAAAHGADVVTRDQRDLERLIAFVHGDIRVLEP